MPANKPHVSKVHVAILAWLWPERFRTTQPQTQEIATATVSPEDNNNNANANANPSDRDINQNSRTDSDISVLSTDSYLASLDPLDKTVPSFLQLCQEILILDTGRDILQERKILSHRAKKRKEGLQRISSRLLANWRRSPESIQTDTWVPAPSTKRKWTAAMEEEYAVYKAKVAQITEARKQAGKAGRVATDSIKRKEDVVLREMKLGHALDYHQVWFDTAIEFVLLYLSPSLPAYLGTYLVVTYLHTLAYSTYYHFLSRMF